MLVWMSNKDHGHMPVYSALEVAAAKKAGWVECSPPPWPKAEDKTLHLKKKVNVDSDKAS